MNYSVYSYLLGDSVEVVDNKIVQDCANFIGKIQEIQKKSLERITFKAKDASFTVFEHIELTNLKIKSTIIFSKKIRFCEIYDWLLNEFVPKFNIIQSRIVNHYESILNSRVVDIILSPSDFGFHNMKIHQNKLLFFDFEYSGWDDPAKLCCDFICQPDNPISDDHAYGFVENLSNILGMNSLHERVDILLPLYRIRWCLIMLNVAMKKFSYAHSETLHLAEINPQITKALNYYQTHLSQI